MPRRREVPKRRIIPDPKFKDKLVTKFTNSLMLGGKKATAEGILYGAFDVIKDRFKEDPIDVFRKALDNVKPKLEVKSRRVGGATYQVPVEVRPSAAWRSPCAGSSPTRAPVARRRCASASPPSSSTPPRTAATR
jgi:ribosomal protein S7